MNEEPESVGIRILLHHQFGCKLGHAIERSRPFEGEGFTDAGS